MLCLHGGAVHAHWFDFVASGLNDEYHVLALDQRGHGDRLLAGRPTACGRGAAGDRGHLPGLGQRDPRGPAGHAGAGQWDHRPGRFGAGLSRHSTAGAILRRQACRAGVLRLAARRAAARRQRRGADDGAAAGAEYAAVRLGEEPAARTGAARAADLSAGADRASDRPHRIAPEARAMDRLEHHQGDPRSTDHTWPAGPVPCGPRVELANDDVSAERCFAPWVDMEAELRGRGLPLFSLESRRAPPPTSSPTAGTSGRWSSRMPI